MARLERRERTGKELSNRDVEKASLIVRLAGEMEDGRQRRARVSNAIRKAVEPAAEPTERGSSLLSEIGTRIDREGAEVADNGVGRTHDASEN